MNIAVWLKSFTVQLYLTNYESLSALKLLIPFRVRKIELILLDFDVPICPILSKISAIVLLDLSRYCN